MDIGDGCTILFWDDTCEADVKLRDKSLDYTEFRLNKKII